MFNVIKKEIEWAGTTLTLETGRVARQADAAVMVTYGETVVLCTVVSDKNPKEGIDFFPLTVVYQEKTFSAGRIPSGFFKREGRPTQKEVLTSRLIDRPIRPLFPDGYHSETQVICTVLSHDLVNDPDIPAMVGAAAALSLSGVPFGGPLAGARVGYKDGQFILNPTITEIDESDLDLVVAGTKDSVLMVESEAKELSEDTMLQAVTFGHDGFQPVIKIIEEMTAEANPEMRQFHPKKDEDLKARIEEAFTARFTEAYQETAKQKRVELLSNLRSAIAEEFPAEEYNAQMVQSITKSLEKKVVRQRILNNQPRIDGRTPSDVRQIESQVDILPRTHGSALFTRGETQALVVTTLGTTQDEQIIDSLERPDSRERFMLHYNFPPYSVGEATPLRAPGRREIGHGKLAWRALNSMIPSKEEFPYTIRVVSEITESNGSSSMASVCGASLAMMDAGIPIKRPVAGIAMGLIKEPSGYVVLSDIMGDEDHLGDMDFKVAGTDKGVTALQMDIKISGITTEIMQQALKQAHEGRLHILSRMNSTMGESRESLNKNAPTITTIKIHKDKIREVIGSGGKVIREICEVSGAKVDIEDDGTIQVSAVNAESSDKALKMIQDIVAEPEVGQVYVGKVVKIMEFGCFVNFLGPNDGLVHISEIADERVNNVNDYVNEGMEVKVKLLEIDNRGRYKLSMRVVDQNSGVELATA